MTTELNLPDGVTIERSKGARAGYRKIGRSHRTLQGAIDRLVADGHLPGRKCEVWRTRYGWEAVVYKQGRLRRAVAEITNEDGGTVVAGLPRRKQSLGRKEMTPRNHVLRIEFATE